MFNLFSLSFVSNLSSPCNQITGFENQKASMIDLSGVIEVDVGYDDGGSVDVEIGVDVGVGVGVDVWSVLLTSFPMVSSSVSRASQNCQRIYINPVQSCTILCETTGFQSTNAKQEQNRGTGEGIARTRLRCCASNCGT
jgi:hypothetical protein